MTIAGTNFDATFANDIITFSNGAIFTNNTGQTMTQFTLSYMGEEWWAKNKQNSVAFP